jgi:HD-GYP domain-containing protein (c-di-GMP phosphodiesterase class II)
LPRRLRLYLLATVAVASTACVVAVVASPPDVQSLPLATLVLVLAAIALRAPVKLDRKTKLTLEDAVTFAGALLLTPALAMLAVSASTLVALRFGRVLWYEKAFNAAKAALAIGAASVVYHGLSLVPREIDLRAAVIAAVVKYLVATSLVDLATGIQLGRAPFAKWWVRRRVGIVPAIGLHLFGVLGAVAAMQDRWVLALLLVPTAAMLLLLREGRAARERSAALLSELAELADLRDPRGRGFAREVAALAERMAVRASLPADRVALVRDCARLHSVGLLDLAPANGAVDTADFRRHPELGARRLAQVHELHEHATVLAMHHEQPDGSGYPRRLRDGSVPLEASVIGLAETYLEMRHEEECDAPTDVRAALVSGRGSRWHEVAVDALVTLLDEEERTVAVPSTATA